MIKTNKQWVICFFVLLLIIMILIAIFIIIIDPYFHYHKPLPFLQYKIYNERYQNDGIIKHFDYDAIITGTSMSQNFKTSELNSLFDVNSVKVCFSGATFREINNCLVTATKYNPNIKMIVRSIDISYLNFEPDRMKYEDSYYPNYLYDSNIFNDYMYYFNKDVILDSLNNIKHTIRGHKTTTFDEYSNWNKKASFGNVLEVYNRPEKVSMRKLKDELLDREKRNVTENVTNLAKEHPEIQFYLFFPPYSIYYWDRVNQLGLIQNQLTYYEYAAELMFEFDNIHLFSFHTLYDIIGDQNNYRDESHYHEDINSQILVWMKEGKYELTKENYKQYFQEISNYYLNYDYESLFE